MVDGHIPRHVCDKGAKTRFSDSTCRERLGNDVLLKLVDCSHVIGFDERTVIACRAGQFGSAIRNVVIAWTIGGGGKLLEEL